MTSPMLLPEDHVQESAAPERLLPEAVLAPGSAGAARDLTREIVSGTSTLGVAVLVERGATFAANILAARFAGAAIFGAYSVGISTANNISTYAAGGIGATATRFSGKYPYQSGNYATLARVLAVVSIGSGLIAGSALYFGAGPVAHLLGKESLAGLLRWASLSAVGMLILECARGFFVGQHRLAALALLSLLVGSGMVGALPVLAAGQHPAGMLAAHGTITLSAVLICLLLARPLGLLAQGGTASVGFVSMLREVWGFGLIQLSGLLSANLAGWWITALVARGDTSLVQIGFFAIASQLRNLTGIIPGLLTEGSYATIASVDVEDPDLPQRIVALCTFASTTVSLVLASLGILLAPLALRLMYGARFAPAAMAASVGMGVAVLQMGNAPPSARVSVVSIRSVAVINTIWAVFTAVVGTLLMLRWANATSAMVVFFVAHIVSSSLVLGVLARKDRIPAGLVGLFALSTLSVILLTLLAWLRETMVAHTTILSAIMLLVMLASYSGLYLLARRFAWLSALTKIQGQLVSGAFTLRRFLLRRRDGRTILR